MKAEELLQHFERISEAPDAIKRLRRFILDLAVRGTLVEQDPSDEPATELLKRIAAEKARLVKASKIKAKPSLAEVTDDQAPYKLPSSWQWVRFANIVDFSAGRTPSRNEPRFWNSGDYYWVSIADMQEGQVLTATKETVSREAREQVFRSKPEEPGTIIMSFKLTIGKIARLGVTAFHNEAIISIRPHIADLDAYLFKVLPQFARQGDTKGAIKGATLNRESISNIFFPLPPLAEQHRIVAKVDELMNLCDQLEAAKAERDKCRDNLVAASLQGLNQPAEEEETFREHARFTFNNLPRITTRATHIKQLRQAILNLAVRGKLVEQDPSDEPAKELLKRIEAEKEILLNEGMIRKSKPLDTIQANELPFEAPWQWAWTRIGNAVLLTQYGTSQKSQPAASGVSVLAMGNIQDGSVVWGNEKRIPQTSSELPELYLRKFDLLYNRTNSAELVGKTGIFLGEDNAITFASYLIRLRPSLAWSNPRFVNMAMNTSEFRATQIVPLIKKQTGQANVNGTALKNMLIPLPPLAEQHRIVAKVDELMAICDQLEAQITATQQDSRRFLETVLADALAPGMDLGAEAQVA